MNAASVIPNADQCGRGALTPLERRWSNNVLRGEGTPPTGVACITKHCSPFGCGLRMTGIKNALADAIVLTSRLLLFVALFSTATAHAAETPRGGRVGWARLITESSSWTVHNANDPLLAEFIREKTSLNIDPTCYPVDPRDLEKLCAYPFVFTNNLTNIHAAKTLDNLREYLKRGGFIYIDRCVNLSFSLEQEDFYERHAALFARFLPGSELRELPPSHEINRCYFTSDTLAKRTARSNGHNGIYGVFYEGRMVILLSNANLQCGWPNGNNREPAMQMIANIYVYAMTR